VRVLSLATTSNWSRPEKAGGLIILVQRLQTFLLANSLLYMQTNMAQTCKSDFLCDDNILPYSIIKSSKYPTAFWKEKRGLPEGSHVCFIPLKRLWSVARDRQQQHSMICHYSAGKCNHTLVRTHSPIDTTKLKKNRRNKKVSFVLCAAGCCQPLKWKPLQFYCSRSVLPLETSQNIEWRSSHRNLIRYLSILDSYNFILALD